MNTTYLSYCNLYISNSNKLAELAKKGIETRDAWIKRVETVMGYKEEELAIMVRSGDLYVAGLRVSPDEDGWRKQDNVWVPRLSTKLGKEHEVKMLEVGCYKNNFNKWMEENGLVFETYKLLGAMRGMMIDVNVLANAEFNSFVWCVPTDAPDEIHANVKQHYGGELITGGKYLDEYSDHKYRIW